jgi:competence protein ComEC
MRVVTRETLKLIVLGILFFATIFVIYLSYQLAPKNYLKVSFLDVGQGDSILFQTPRGGKVLIDGGRDKVVLSRLGNELPIYSKNIELVIATHSDGDHITGLIDVLKNYNVKVMLYSRPNANESLSKELMRVAAEKNVEVIQITKPMIIQSEDGLIIKLLFPVTNMDGALPNDASIVSQFIFGENKFMLTGDLPMSGEIYLARKYDDNLKSDVLKLGHHGSDTSTHPDFLQKVEPEIAIVSAGKDNSFGHPHRSVVSLLEKFGIKLLRTDELGTINLYSNGLNIWQE